METIEQFLELIYAVLDEKNIQIENAVTRLENYEEAITEYAELGEIDEYTYELFDNVAKSRVGITYYPSDEGIIFTERSQDESPVLKYIGPKNVALAPHIDSTTVFEPNLNLVLPRNVMICIKETNTDPRKLKSLETEIYEINALICEINTFIAAYVQDREYFMSCENDIPNLKIDLPELDYVDFSLAAAKQSKNNRGAIQYIIPLDSPPEPSGQWHTVISDTMDEPLYFKYTLKKVNLDD